MNKSKQKEKQSVFKIHTKRERDKHILTNLGKCKESVQDLLVHHLRKEANQVRLQRRTKYKSLRMISLTIMKTSRKKLSGR